MGLGVQTASSTHLMLLLLSRVVSSEFYSFTFLPPEFYTSHARFFSLLIPYEELITFSGVTGDFLQEKYQMIYK